MAIHGVIYPIFCIWVEGVRFPLMNRGVRASSGKPDQSGRGHFTRSIPHKLRLDRSRPTNCNAVKEA